MSMWAWLLAASAATPAAGAWMSLGTALGSVLLLGFLRRLLPPEDRHHGSVTLTFLVIGFLLGVFRLALVAAGAGDSAAGAALGILATFFVALGSVGTIVMLFLEVVPTRAHLHFPSILRDLIHVLAFGVIVFGLLTHSGVNVVSIVTTSAVLTAVVGLALQSTMSNLFSGIVLHMDRALGIGDWVQVGQRIGRITQMGWRSVILRTRDGDTVIIPNGHLTSQEVYNFSRPSTQHRISMKVGFHYRHPPNQVREVVRQAIIAAPGVLPDPIPHVFPMEFGDSAIIYKVRFWLDDFYREHDIEGEVLTRIWYAARRSGLEIPFPIHTVLNVDAGVASGPAPDTEVPARVTALERLDLFAPLERADLELLARGLRNVDFAAGETIIRQGDPGDSLFLIARGSVAVSLGRDGDGAAGGGIASLVARLGPGDFFGEMSLMTGESRSATCIANTDVACYELDHAAFQRLLTSRPRIADEMSALLTRRQETLARKGTELSARAAQGAEAQNLLARIKTFFNLT